MLAIVLANLIIATYADKSPELVQDLLHEAPAGSMVLLQESVALKDHVANHKTRDFGKIRLRPGQTPMLPEESGLIQKLQQEPTTTVTNQSWFSRLGESFGSVLVGLILIPFSLALMWMNERRNAQQESILSLGLTEVQSISSKSVDEKLHGTLVHLNDADAAGMDEMKDRRFPALCMSSGCLRLKSEVQVYQWKETKKEEKKKDSLGGGETTITRYEYSKIWSGTQIDSASFNQPSHSNSISVSGLNCGTEETTNSTVKYGDSHYLPQPLVQQLGDWQDANGLIKIVEFGGKRFEKSEDWFFYPGAAAAAPTVGSVRVRFKYVQDGPASVMALQTDDKQHPNAATFLPYRLVYRGFCGGISGDALQEALLAQGSKDGEELYEEEACNTGPLACLCCCCNLITRCFSHLAPPQVFAAFHGRSSPEECFQKLALFGQMLKWGLRLLSWLLLYAGTYALFQPLLVVLDIIPFLGPYISSGAGWVVGLAVFLVTAMMATLVISIAFLLYHPLVGLTYLACVGLLVGATIGISRALS